MENKVHAVKGIPCLYCYVYRSGKKRYFIKTQYKGHIYTQNLSVPERIHPNKLKQLAFAATQQIKKSKQKSLQEYLEDYIILRQLKPKTAREYRRILRQYTFNETDNQKLFMQSVVSARNLIQITRTVNAFFRWLIENGVSIRNPAALVKPPKVHVRSRTLSLRDIKKLYRALQNESIELQLLTRLLCETGARISSILALSANDLKKDGLHLYNVKCGRAYPLAIPLSKETQALWAKVCQNNQTLFAANAPSLTRHLRRLLDKLFNTEPNTERIVIHSLRHTTATLALQSGIPIELVGQMLDHVNINTTYHIYARPSLRQLQNAFVSLQRSYGQ
ncbi:MAG: tyrosine-type recombinase/integrase [Proteobacteria bacterium]|nr:tyrosine-type recombinase/integrase [Pseudomonadota bacterium]